MKVFIFLFLLVICNVATALEGRVVSVADGDTLTVLDENNIQYKIRLSQIDAPEKNQPWGDRSRQSLMAFCIGKKVSVVITDTDRYGRSIGVVLIGDSDAAAHQLEAGLAWVYDRYVTDHRLYRIQDQAKKNRIGLWSDAKPIAPWLWRSVAPK